MRADALAIWRAEALVDQLRDGQPVAEWIDQQTSLIARATGNPRLVYHVAGGRAAVRFDPTDDVDFLLVDRNQSPLSEARDFSIAVRFATNSSTLMGSDGSWFDHSAIVDGSRRGFTYDWGLSMNSAGQLTAGVGQGFSSPSQTLVSRSDAQNNGLWHTAIFRREGTMLTLQVDSGPVAQLVTPSATTLATLDLTIGAQPAGRMPFQGDIAEVRLYRSALSDDDVSALHQEWQAYYVNSAPQATPDTYVLSEDSTRFSPPLDHGVLANDLDIDGDMLSAELIDTTEHGKLNLLPNGSFEYTPQRNYFGTDQFTYVARDRRPSSPTRVELTVTPTYDAPILIQDKYNATPDQPIAMEALRGVLANDLQVDKTPLRATLAQPPSFGDVRLEADGSFVFDPLGQTGTAQFTYDVDDGTRITSGGKVMVQVNRQAITISEFLAVNATSESTRVRTSPTAPFSGERSTPDWIELENLSDAPVNLAGLFLSDDRRIPEKWELPEGATIAANGRIVIYASGRNVLDTRLDEHERYHTNFTLAHDDGYLGLFRSDGSPLSEWGPHYPVQLPDISYGTAQDTAMYFRAPTPERANAVGVSGVVGTPEVSVPRGFYEHAFTLVLSSSTPGATLAYTTDGSLPTLDHGTRITASSPTAIPEVTLEIGATTTLRVAAFHPDLLPTPVVTHSYFFVADIVKQSGLWRTVTQDATWRSLLDDSLLSLPSISLVLDRPISLTETATSVEMVFPDGTPGFQINSGVEHYGNHSLNSPKKNMRLSFKSQYGEGSLHYDLFGKGATTEFEQLLLRTGSHDNWFWTHPSGGRGNYLRNRWSWDRQLEMGQLAPHGRFVHVYINSRYWGLHELMERPDAEFMASYLGGTSDDYDALNAGVPIDGTITAWESMQKNAVIDNYSQLQQYLDVGNYADYMLLSFYSGNDWDWNPEGNWMAARRRAEGAGYIFFAWDTDFILRSTADATVVERGGPSRLWSINGGVRQHKDFLMLLADRAQQYFLDGGMFTDDRVRADFQQMADSIRLAVIAETARWGQAASPYTPRDWENAVQWMQDRFVPTGPGGRAETVIGQLRQGKYFPSIDAPAFWVNADRRREANLISTDRVSITAGQGLIYYTTDGSDPRRPGGSIAPQAIVWDGQPLQLVRTTAMRARAFANNEWSAITEGTFRVDTIAASAATLRLTEIQYHPAEPSFNERRAGFADADQFEYLELVNVAPQTLDLRDVRLTSILTEQGEQGIDFAFAGSHAEFLPPQQRVVVVKNLAAFTKRYGDQPFVAGEWSGTLSNSSEQITLQSSAATFAQFAYSDRWWRETDGDGPSLQLVHEQAFDPSTWERATSWRISRLPLGTPGEPDTGPLPGDANRDAIFNSSDLALVFAHGEYEDDRIANSTWEEGDWNGDGEFNSADLVLALANGNYSESALLAFLRDESKNSPS